jgi:bifunctional pyridoxal-dependent enzyme with beta-cystathionase and maltose regulon repressor activities
VIVTFEPSTLAFNVVRQNVDTLTAKIAKNRPLPMPLTTGGNYEQQRRAKLFGRAIDGQFDLAKVWEVSPVIARDAALFGNVLKAHQNLTFTTPPNLQRGIAVGLAKDDAYFAGLSASLEAKRDLLAAGLAELGFGVLPTQGSYFITCDLRPVAARLGFNGDDVAFCRTLTTDAKVTAIPVTAFYAEPDPPRHFIRFAFCKNEAVLTEALSRMRAWIGARAAAVRAAG